MNRKDNPSIKLRFGQAVQRRRLALGLSQESLAERSELHRTYIADIERGGRNVSLENIERIAGALETSMHELLGDVERQ
jgi:transcriptional regulator with XRE-family HTH domain